MNNQSDFIDIYESRLRNAYLCGFLDEYVEGLVTLNGLTREIVDQIVINLYSRYSKCAHPVPCKLHQKNKIIGMGTIAFCNTRTLDYVRKCRGFIPIDRYPRYPTDSNSHYNSEYGAVGNARFIVGNFCRSVVNQDKITDYLYFVAVPQCGCEGHPWFRPIDIKPVCISSKLATSNPPSTIDW
jgi:hypothetical protein